MFHRFHLSLCLTILLGALGLAQPPRKITYQGALVYYDLHTKPKILKAGQYAVQFDFYNDRTSTDPLSIKLTETDNIIPDKKTGAFTVVFGENNSPVGSFDLTVFTQYLLWLQVTIKSGPETKISYPYVVPGRAQLTTVPYAANAEFATMAVDAGSAEFAVSAGTAASVTGMSSTITGLSANSLGRNNQISNEASNALGESNIVAGLYSNALGYANTLSSNATKSNAIGANNTISAAGSVALGYQNSVAGSSSIAAGANAQANHSNTFVWADGSTFPSTAANQFLVHASGGVGINTNAPAAGGLTINGGTQLGTDAPAIKMKLLTGMAPATTGGVIILSHGLLHSAILSIRVLVQSHFAGFSDSWIESHWTESAGLEYAWYEQAGQIRLNFKSGNDTYLLGQPVQVLITYLAQ